MTSLVGLVRRSLWLVLLLAASGAAYTWWRDRDSANSPGPAEWPPLVADPSPNAAAASAAPAELTSTAPSGEPAGDRTANAAEAHTDTDTGWVEPADDGSCPITHPIKANDKSGIFHLPDGRFYERTKAERCYATTEAALADDYRQSKN